MSCCDLLARTQELNQIIIIAQVVGGLHKCLTCVKVDTKFALCFKNLTLHDCTINDGRCKRGHEASLDHQQLSMKENNLFVCHIDISQIDNHNVSYAPLVPLQSLQ
jgi:hypothetical protein